MWAVNRVLSLIFSGTCGLERGERLKVEDSEAEWRAGDQGEAHILQQVFTSFEKYIVVSSRQNEMHFSVLTACPPSWLSQNKSI